MKSYLLASLLLFAPIAVHADEASHRKAVSELLDLVIGPETFKKAFWVGMQPALDNLKQQGLPPAAETEMRAAIEEWLEKEMNWNDMKPEFVDLYIKEFTEEDIAAMLAFYQTPAGKKSITSLPNLMQQGSMIGQRRAEAKQELLTGKIQAIMGKYKP